MMPGSLELPAVSPSHRKLLCTLWCLRDSRTSLCCLLSRLSSLCRRRITQSAPELGSSSARKRKKEEEEKKKNRKDKEKDTEDGDHPADLTPGRRTTTTTTP
ncbi:hypothetical protein DNTS_009434 [Danionella cerebrum]|uniref:Uncharacterized protein n=1 Tax=Danionella cerebrum TaxID=2873325 RepID=A0A553NIE3_9TELE|nr:hypothetical protein DNTS_009434 [Danionella translucida]